MSGPESEIPRKDTQDRSSLFSILSGEWMDIPQTNKVQWRFSANGIKDCVPS